MIPHLWADARVRLAGFAAMGLLVALCSLATDLDTDVLSVDLIASVGGRPDERQRALARLAAAGLIAREAAGVRLLVRIVDGDEGVFDDDDGASEEPEEPEEHDASAPRARLVLTDSERRERERARDRLKKERKRERLRNVSPFVPSLSHPSCPPSVPPGASPIRPLPVPPSSPVDASPSASPSLSEKALSSSPEREGDAKGDEGGRREVPAQTDGRTALFLADADTPPAWAHQEAEIRALGTGIKVDVRAVWARFVAHAVGEGRTAASWRALWRNWLSNERPPTPGRAPRAGIIKQKSAPDAPWLKAGKAS